MTIRDNQSKLLQLSFSQPIEMKPFSQFKGINVLVPKKKKK